MQSLTCYKASMPKPTINNEDKKNEVLGVSVSSKTKGVIEDLAKSEDRSLSYIGGALLLRGLAAFQRDGLLKEPDGGNGDSARQPILANSVIEESKKQRALKAQQEKKRKGGLR